MFKHLTLVSLALFAIILSACGAQAPAAPISVREPWVRAAVMITTQAPAMTATEGTGMAHGSAGSGSNSAAYLTLVNSSDTADALIGAASDVAETVELHTMEMKDNVMQMRPVPRIDIPSKGEVSLAPGGFHIMLLGLKRDLKDGETVKLTLTLEKAGKIEVSAPVRQS